MKLSRKTVVVLGALVVLFLGSSQVAIAQNPTSGPAAAHIVEFHGSDFYPNRFALRTGNSSFGLIHIQNGGSTKNKANHETTSYAKGLWDDAIINTASTIGDFDLIVRVKQYNTPGGTARTMCVVIDQADYSYSGTNYGTKGIITAFWISGHKSGTSCNSTD